MEDDEVSTSIVQYIRRLTRGVPRHHKDAYLVQRLHQASQTGFSLEATIIRAELLSRDTIERPLLHSFNFNSFSSHDCMTKFRFNKEQIVQLIELIGLTDITTKEGTRATGVEGLCIVMYRLAVPMRWIDMENTFGRHSCGLSNLFLHVLQLLDDRYANLLYLNHSYAVRNLAEYADSVFQAGGVLPNVWAFIDGTVRGICRPTPRNAARDGELLSQQSVYSGHKRKHALKYQTLTTPDGLISHVFGGFPGRNHDIKMFHESKLAKTIREDERFRGFRIYGDHAYGRDDVMACPFAGAIGNLTSDEKKVNSAMSKVRVSVEWSYSHVVNYWTTIDFKRSQRAGTTPVSQMYRVAVLLTNCITCSRGGNSVSDSFKLSPPSLREYLSQCI